VTLRDWISCDIEGLVSVVSRSKISNFSSVKYCNELLLLHGAVLLSTMDI